MTVGLPTAGRDYVYSEKVLREGAVEPGLAVNMGILVGIHVGGRSVRVRDEDVRGRTRGGHSQEDAVESWA